MGYVSKQRHGTENVRHRDKAYGDYMKWVQNLCLMNHTSFRFGIMNLQHVGYLILQNIEQESLPRVFSNKIEKQ